jgi:hypothetical protein
MNTNPSIQCINHASVMINDKEVCLLTDPWFWGAAFHDGWSLIHENSEREIHTLLEKVTHIWISHEHPDHFSVPFFIKFSTYLVNKKIKIFFQNTKDKRVVKFLRSRSFDVEELDNGKEYKLSSSFYIKCVNSGFYDSALLINVNGTKIFNLNDCPIRDDLSLNKFKKKYGTCDVLLTQFSYAAWKGGEENVKWRRDAAREKISILLSQANILSAKVVIPFASFVRFSNIYNSYLNDSVNTPDVLIKSLQNEVFSTVVFKPMEIQNIDNLKQSEKSLYFWKEKYQGIEQQKLLEYKDVVKVSELQELYKEYRSRILKNNSYWMIWLLSKFGFFKKVEILTKDLGSILSLDILSKKLIISYENPDLIMHSQSLKFILSNSFGYDTLTVNGCFEEGGEGSFLRSTKTLAIENLNNMGVYLKPSIVFRLDLIFFFMRLISRVSKKLK